ncbi:unnamed protein product [Prunus armeniaca]
MRPVLKQPARPRRPTAALHHHCPSLQPLKNMKFQAGFHPIFQPFDLPPSATGSDFPVFGFSSSLRALPNGWVGFDQLLA